MSWPMVSIESVAKVITGKTPPKADPNCFGGNIPFITPSELTDSDYLLKPDTTLTEKGLATTKLIPKNSILVCCIGSLGKMAMADLPIATNQQINSVIFDEDKIYYRFGFYALKLLKNELKNIAPSTTVAIVNKSRFSELKIPRPPLEEQRRIAGILDKASGILQKREQAVKLGDDFLRATFLEMFGDPVSNPKGWKVRPLKELSLKIASGSTPKGGSKVYVDKGITFFRSQNVWKNDIRLDDVAYIDEKTHNNLKKSSLKHKDILMTKTGRFNTENSSLGRAALFLGKDDCANVNGHVYLIRLKPGILHEFIVYILTSNEYREHIREVCVGGIDKRQLNKEHIEDFPIICPPDYLQMEFMRKLNFIQKIRSNAMTGLKEVTPLFNTLSQKAFSDGF
ncbi:restriction endonuclease subunit S [Citrobacter cronae]|uniref:restriction endonuclease subunit S n=1 Tax=Citrobacter cronae TaxID=1748967 RepID=UPI0019023856|nr:restriction endonuclease subunit S [Citrobacter cronae]MBJ8415317.1 restriction endonuclease subunit S [Citrobacter cronae]